MAKAFDVDDEDDADESDDNNSSRRRKLSERAVDAEIDAEEARTHGDLPTPTMGANSDNARARTSTGILLNSGVCLQFGLINLL